MDSTTTTTPPVPTTATADPAPIPPPLLAFLAQLKLSSYAQALADLGYDDVDFLSIMEKEKLKSAADAAKMLPGHKAKFVWALTTSVGGTTKPAAAPENNDAVLAIVVDRSGSMSSMGSEVMNGYNTFLEEQQKLPGECTATIIRFDNEVEVVHEALALAKIPAATVATFEPRGMTALYDAIGTAIAKVQQQIRALPKPPSRVMIMILTDGAENASKIYTRARISKDIKRLTNKSKWEFVFIGANQDAVHTGASMGVAARNCITFDADKVHAKNAWGEISANCTMYRSPCMDSGFSTKQRTATTSSPSYPSGPSGPF